MALTDRTAGSGANPFQVLKDYERRSLAHAVGLPEQAEIQGVWTGIGFRLDEYRLAAAISDIREILPVPPLTRVPGASSWLLGVANIRGLLAAVIDLRGFLEGQETPQTPRCRILLVHQEGGAVGLLVDEVVGMRRFGEEQAVADWELADTFVEPLIESEYEHDGQRWGIFDLGALLRQPEFTQAAA